MTKIKSIVIIILFFLIIFCGIFRINIDYNKKVGKQQENISSDSTQVPGTAVLNGYTYSEINLSRKEGKKLKIYYKSKPFDLRLDIGSYVIYLNNQVYNNVIKEKDLILNKIMSIIDGGVYNLKNKILMRDTVN